MIVDFENFVFTVLIAVASYLMGIYVGARYVKRGEWERKEEVNM